MLVFLHLSNLFNLVSQKRKAGYDYGTITSSKIGYSGDTFMITCISATEPVWQVQNPYRIALEPISSQHIKWGNNLFLQNVTFMDNGYYYCRGEKGPPGNELFYRRTSITIVGKYIILLHCAMIILFHTESPASLTWPSHCC